jgi:hypothetical protein
MLAGQAAARRSGYLRSHLYRSVTGDACATSRLGSALYATSSPRRRPACLVDLVEQSPATHNVDTPPCAGWQKLRSGLNPRETLRATRLLRTAARSAPLSTRHFASMAATNVNKQVDVDFTTPRDPNTLSNYHNFVTRHTSVDFEIDFEKRILSGAVELEFESLTDDHVAQIVLDSRCVCCGGALARKLSMN